MKTPTLYNMIVQSEDTNRTVVEMLIYALLILSAAVSIFRVAVQPVVVPGRIATAQVTAESRA